MDLAFQSPQMVDDKPLSGCIDAVAAKAGRPLVFVSADCQKAALRDALRAARFCGG